MNPFFRALRMDLTRGLKAPTFYLTILAVALLQMLGAWQELRITPNVDVFSIYCIQTLNTTSVAVAALPFAVAFCLKWRYRFTYYAIQRSCITAYSWSKMITAAILGGPAFAA